MTKMLILGPHPRFTEEKCLEVRLRKCPFRQTPLVIRKFEDDWLSGVIEELKEVPPPLGF